MRTTFGPPRLTVLAVRPGSPVTIFRIVRSALVDDPAFVNSLRSNYELGEEPRKVERDATVIHMGISAYLEPGIAHGNAQRWPKLGDHVAEVRLQHGRGFNYAHTGHPLHLTIWADPIKLSEAVVDVEPVKA